LTSDASDCNTPGRLPTSSQPFLHHIQPPPYQILTMSTHSAVATVGIKASLGLIQVPTARPIGEQVRVRVEWTASTPLDLHQNDGGLLVKHPQVLGDGCAGTVIEVGPEAKRLQVGDKVFGFTWQDQAAKAHQEFCTTDECLLAKVCAVHLACPPDSSH
jgi:NADPH:quinone reductase-like Zn-dependent oxidoreductase